MNQSTLESSFQEFWSALFSSSVHLDSLLSKQDDELKPWFAEVAHAFLLRPVSLASGYGVGIRTGEPWSMWKEDLIDWQTPSRLMGHIFESGWIPGMPLQFDESVPAELNYPPEMVSQMREESGGDELMRKLLQRPHLSLRVRRKFQPSDFASTFEMKPKLQEISPQGLSFEKNLKVMKNEFFERGDFEIQDEGSQILSFFALWPEVFADILSNRPGVDVAKKKFEKLPPALSPSMKIIDACAGAGGKSLAMADAVSGKARVYSYDVAEKKLQALKRRAGRTDLRNIQTRKVTEGQEVNELKPFARTADRVLVDAPCSGWGVLKRSPDIKWRQSKEFLGQISNTQLRLLSTYSELVKAGGILTYGLCTFRKQETEEVVAEFLKQHSDFEKGPGGYLGPDLCDGFFMQSFKRIK